MARSLSALGLFVGLLAASAQEPPLGFDTTPVALPPALKSALAKRVSVEKAEGTVEELVKKVATDNKVKIDFSPLMKGNEALQARGALVAQKEARLDLVLHNLLTNAGVTTTCVVKGDTLLFTPQTDPAAVVTNKKGVRGVTYVSAVRQPPDAKHTAAVAAVRKKLDEKADYDAVNATPLTEVLATIAKKSGLMFFFHEESFAVNGERDARDKTVSAKGGKDVTHGSVLRDALKAAGAEFYLDPYGLPMVVQADFYRARLQKK